MKKFPFALVLLCLISCMSGCSSQTTSAAIPFSEYYQNIDSFDEIRPHLEQYFWYVCSAYVNSDKNNIGSFELPEEFEETQDMLHSFHDERKTMQEVHLFMPFVKINVMIAKQKLMKSVWGCVEDPDWFEKLNTLIEDSMVEYSTRSED